jgi:site-specific DNA recombinase
MGYKATRGAKALGVDTEKVETVKQVFTIRQEWPGISLRKIAELLNGEGYTTTRGKAFTPVQVKRVLDREDLYRGLWHYAGLSSRGQHEAIIT